VVLHQRAGGTRNSLKKVYDAQNTPALAALGGKVCAGRWTLQVQDAEAQDSGTLASFSVRLVLGPAGARVLAARKAVTTKAVTKKVAPKKAAARKQASKPVARPRT
jgi:subtilisin-like proprotein convertase family protein